MIHSHYLGPYGDQPILAAPIHEVSPAPPWSSRVRSVTMDFRRPAIRVRSPELLFARPRFARSLGLGDCRRRGSNCAMCFLVLGAASLAPVEERTGGCGWFPAEQKSAG